MIYHRIVIYIFLFIGGAIVGSLCDQIHLQANVLYYAHPLLFGQAWWVALQYGLATTCAFLGARFFLNLSKFSYTQKNLISTFVWFLGAYFASAFLQNYSIFLALLFFGIWGLRILLMRDVRGAIYSCLFAVIGTSYEILLVHIGLFTYTHPNMLGVPFWLPGLYLNAGLLAIVLTRFIEAR